MMTYFVMQSVKSERLGGLSPWVGAYADGLVTADTHKVAKDGTLVFYRRRFGIFRQKVATWAADVWISVRTAADVQCTIDEREEKKTA